MSLDKTQDSSGNQLASSLTPTQAPDQFPAFMTEPFEGKGTSQKSLQQFTTVTFERGCAADWSHAAFLDHTCVVDCPYGPKDKPDDTRDSKATVVSGVVGEGFYIQTNIANVECQVQQPMMEEKIWTDATGVRMDLLKTYCKPVTATNRQPLTVIGRWSTVMYTDGLNLACDVVFARDAD
ncbi:Hypothetical predicted protein [Scomber scombrus]|uniref:Uncharacterized protein n=1 Tax=Scomber scombrus TaxID=13677 RepID=A0AAV1MSN5_SCOSC